MWSRSRFLLLALVVALLGLGPVPTAPASAVAPALTVAPRQPVVGDTVRFRATLPTRVRRPVQLQRSTAGRWTTVARGWATRAGRVDVGARVTSGRTTWRVVAQPYRGRRVVTTRAAVVTAATEGVTLSTSIVDGRGRARVVASHPVAGRPVQLQARTGAGAWTSVATGRSTTSSATVLTSELAAVQGRSLRAVLPAYGGRAAVASAVQEPPTVVVGAVADGETASATATTTGTVQAVRFFLDGVLLATDTRAPWTASWSPRVGRHDVVARAIGPLDSALSDAVDVTTTAAPVTADTGVAEGFAIEVVQDGLDLPTSAATLPSGAVLVTEKAGVVQVVEPDDEGGWSLPRPVLDLREEVDDAGDAGLIGIAVDPDAATNGHVYLSYVRDDGTGTTSGAGDRRTQRVVRYTWDGAALGSPHVLLGAGCAPDDPADTDGCLPLIGEAHTVGDLAFDDAGRLLVGVGDGSLYYTSDGLPGRLETLRAQDPDVLAGKVLRIDPATGEGVPGNPSYDGDGSTNASRVLALGLRNPFRFTVHDGHLVIGEVGEGATEEIDLLELDDADEQDEVANYGWPCLEGTAATPLGDVADEDNAWHACAQVRTGDAATPPAYTYAHTGAGGSISGGVFLTSESYPAAVRDRYVFGDYAQGFLRTVEVGHGGSVSDPALLADASAAAGPVKFLTGPDGLVWSVSITTGALRRIRWTGTTPTDQCAVGTFRRTFHDLDGPDSPFDAEVEEGPYSWLQPYASVQLPAETLAPATCEPSIHLDTDASPWTEDDERAHPADRFGTSWRGRVAMDAGTWRFTVSGSEWVRLWVDDQVVHDFYSNAFWELPLRQHDVVLAPGQHVVRAELVHGDEASARAEVGWERVGGPPTVALQAPANGIVAGDGTVPWQVVVGDPDGDPVEALAANTRLEVDFLHYTGDGFHAHPSSRITGELAGTLAVSDVHAPGSGVVRLRASVVDASGARSVSAPVYVCFPGGAVGPCAER
ncbi:MULTISPECIES: PQQ-dependent sugar dehydrogenase [unclassified Nocardioides]|uniref:PQQ-dependent sugar dehydrogenase n=1 Tax=unclassified Nocardioides TaxID=2615069 RepID=UPI000703A4F1|nr:MULTISPECIES: PQQ-dependent sugar dehydrogenase [unclassified Nocardioides]KRC56618.1 hypothetical protein ASE19_01930 [Nocardioides sp. Root79]KRC76830.1 hypothetical protein ASE20_00800 [Nocardioides sp. Root240]